MILVIYQDVKTINYVMKGFYNMNNAERIINPFDELRYKDKLKVTIRGYGERRSKRTAVVLNENVRKKATNKCNWIGCQLNEAVNQLLYIWSSCERINNGTDDTDNQIIRENFDTGTRFLVYGAKLEKRINIALEPTIHKKMMAKCARIGCTFSEAVNQVLYLWAKDEKVDD